MTRGMTPMTKNIIVVDEQGNEYEATYPKRAKGLVKNGRARFVDENKICLACPPDNFETEDIKMSENIAAQEANVTYSVEYILTKIAEIQADTAYLNEALTTLSTMNDGDSGEMGAPENVLGAEKAKALGDIVRCRETTNQQMLRMYEKMYDDIVKKNSAFDMLKDILNVRTMLLGTEGISCEMFDAIIDPLVARYRLTLTPIPGR